MKCSMGQLQGIPIHICSDRWLGPRPGFVVMVSDSRGPKGSIAVVEATVLLRGGACSIDEQASHDLSGHVSNQVFLRSVALFSKEGAVVVPPTDSYFIAYPAPWLELTIE